MIQPIQEYNNSAEYARNLELQCNCYEEQLKESYERIERLKEVIKTLAKELR